MAIQSLYPSIAPSLNLDFANTKALDPRISFSRTSEARFYDGRTVAKAEENLLTFSQEFDQAVWAKTSGSVTANSGAAPDGTSTADNFMTSGDNGTLLQSFTALAAAYTASIWVRRVTGTGTVELTVDGTTWSAIVISDTWTRFSTTLTPSAGARTMGIRLVTSGDAVEVWGAQLEQRSSLTAYQVTTTQPITNYIPVLQTAAANVARFDHNPVTGESLGLLVEEQRTNLLLRSAEFGELAAWGRNNVTVFANTNIAPDGTLSADTVQSNSGGNDFVSQVPTVANGTVVTFSLYVKNINATTSRIMGRNAITSMEISFAWSGSVLTTLIPGTATSSGFAAVGNGWYRVWATYTTGEINQWVRIYPDNSSAGKSVFIWGAQLEAGAFPTSYIPTVASQVTRSADMAVMTGANFSSWYRADEGTLYGDVSYIARQANSPFISVNDGTANNRVVFGRGGFNNETRFGYNVSVGNVTQASSNTSTLAADANIKLALAYKVDDFQLTGNGVGQGADASGTLPVVNQAVIGTITGSPRMNGTIRKLAYYPARLSNAQLQALTT